MHKQCESNNWVLFFIKFRKSSTKLLGEKSWKKIFKLKLFHLPLEREQLFPYSIGPQNNSVREGETATWLTYNIRRNYVVVLWGHTTFENVLPSDVRKKIVNTFHRIFMKYPPMDKEFQSSNPLDSQWISKSTLQEKGKVLYL